MKLRYIVIGLILFAILLFAAVNWALVMQVSTLNLILGKVTAPLGVVLLCALGVVALVYQLLLLRVETQFLLEGRRATKEVDQLRKVAEAAESSRLDGLRKEVAEGFTRNEGRMEGLRKEVAEGFARTQDRMAQTAAGGLETLRKDIAEGFTNNEGRQAALGHEVRPQAPVRDQDSDPPLEATPAPERGATSVSGSIKKVLDKFRAEGGS